MVLRYVVFERVARYSRRLGSGYPLDVTKLAKERLAPSEHMGGRVGTELGLGQVQPQAVQETQRGPFKAEGSGGHSALAEREEKGYCPSLKW